MGHLLGSRRPRPRVYGLFFFSYLEEMVTRDKNKYWFAEERPAGRAENMDS
jgi:hypothetical protein